MAAKDQKRTYGIATYNLASMFNSTEVRVIEDFLVWEGVDIVILTETTNIALTWQDYKYINNFAVTDTRGAGVAWRKDVPLEHIRLHRNGRLLAANLFDIVIIGVYAQSGTARHIQRDRLFTEELSTWIHEI